MSCIPLAAEFADPIANRAASDAEAIGDAGQRLLLDENRPKGLIAAVRAVGRLEKERRVGLAVHDKPPCNMSSIFPSYGRQYDMFAESPTTPKSVTNPVTSRVLALRRYCRGKSLRRLCRGNFNDKSAADTFKFPAKSSLVTLKMSSNFAPRKSALKSVRSSCGTPGRSIIRETPGRLDQVKGKVRAGLEPQGFSRQGGESTPSQKSICFLPCCYLQWYT
jgi:hypothetical protein